MLPRRLRRACKAVAYWSVPAGICDFATRALKREKLIPPLPAPEIKDAVATNSRLHGVHKGERCFILATGPSIQKQDLALLQGELVIAVSFAFLHPAIRIIKPRYHVIAPYHPPFNFDTLGKLFEGFRQYYCGLDVTYLFGHSQYKHSVYRYLEAHPEERPGSYSFIDYSGGEQLNAVNVSSPAIWDIASTPFAPRTVVYSAIQVAVYLGCSEIVLLGCDHDYLSDINRVTGHHFYREEDGQSDKEHLASFNLEQWFGEYYYRWQQYRFMRDELGKRGVSIVNATKGGMLDVFPRRDLEEYRAFRGRQHEATVQI